QVTQADLLAVAVDEAVVTLDDGSCGKRLTLLGETREVTPHLDLLGEQRSPGLGVVVALTRERSGPQRRKLVGWSQCCCIHGRARTRVGRLRIRRRRSSARATRRTPRPVPAAATTTGT